MTEDTFNTEQEYSSKKKYQPPKEVKPEHKELMLKIGNKLAELRKGKKISGLKISKELGISRNSYHYMESGTVYFNVLTLLQVLDYYQMDTLEFFDEL